MLRSGSGNPSQNFDPKENQILEFVTCPKILYFFDCGLSDDNIVILPIRTNKHSKFYHHKKTYRRL